MKISLRSSNDKLVINKKLNWSNLLDSVKKENFELELSKRFIALKDETDLQRVYDDVINHVEVVGVNILGTIKRSKEPAWVSTNTKALIKERDLAKKRSQELKGRPEHEKSLAEWKRLGIKVKEAFNLDEINHLEMNLKSLG